MSPLLLSKNGRAFRVVLSAEEYERLANAAPTRSIIRALHKRSMTRRREVYEALAK